MEEEKEGEEEKAGEKPAEEVDSLVDDKRLFVMNLSY